MDRKRILSIVVLLLFVSLSKGQISERDFVRDSETKCLYVVKNGRKSLVNERVVTVKLKSDSSMLDKNIKVLRSNKLGFADIEVPLDVKVEDYVIKLKQSDLFDGVYYNSFGEINFTPNDLNFGIQNNESYKYINIKDAWDYSTGSPSVKVAVLDTKVAYDHPDLGMGTDGYANVFQPSNWTYGNSLSPDDHGTGVCGIIGAKTHNSIGVSGIAGGNHSNGAKVIPYYSCYADSQGEEHPDFSVVDDAIIAATDAGAKVINMSFGHLTATEGDYPSVDSAIEYAYSHGVVLVASSGNMDVIGVDYPANHSKVIAVGSGNTLNGRSSYSTYGPSLDLVAPGDNLYTTTVSSSGYSYNTSIGTSLSAPIVSGVVALMLSVNPNLTPAEVRDILHKTATKYSGYSYNSDGWCSQIGYGVVNARAAVSLAALSLSGPAVVSSSATYTVENLSQDFDVVWTLSNSYYNQNCIQKNYPTNAQCVITRNSSISMDNATLTATIKLNNNVVKTLTKTVYAHVGFKGTYYNGQTTKTISLPTPLYFRNNITNAKINSPNLIDASVSFWSSMSWSHDATNGIIQFSTPSSNTTSAIHVDCSNGDGYNLTIITTNNSNLLNVLVGDGQIEVSLIPVDDEESIGTSDIGFLAKDATEPLVWTLEVYDATTGRMTFSQKVEGSTFTIDTTSWEPGVYIIKAIVGDEVLSEKVVVK